ncbi:MAG: hypothetical protein J7497_14225 [Chitinophagaceae bacterium]|nr:hypothetical protein [Chitinophagaceae bacterium]
MGNQSLDNYGESILNHYTSVWNNEPEIYLWDKGPFEKLPFNFRILEFAPNQNRDMWTYATSCMSQPDDDLPIETHIFSSKKDIQIVELLTTFAYYHRNTRRIGLNHSVNFGKSWQESSLCHYGLVSLPYLDGPDLEDFRFQNKIVKFY